MAEIELVAMTEFEGGPAPVTFYARGHHDPVEFLAALRREYGYWGLLEAVVLGWMRFIPTPDEDMRYILVDAPKPGPGAFAATSIDEGWFVPQATVTAEMRGDIGRRWAAAQREAEMAETCAHCEKQFTVASRCEICGAAICGHCALDVEALGAEACPTRGWRERPTEPGWYWMLWRGSRRPKHAIVPRVPVGKPVGGMLPAFHWYAYEYGSLVEYFTAPVDCYWYGPIEPPELPELPRKEIT